MRLELTRGVELLFFQKNWSKLSHTLFLCFVCCSFTFGTSRMFVTLHSLHIQWHKNHSIWRTLESTRTGSAFPNQNWNWIWNLFLKNWDSYTQIFSYGENSLPQKLFQIPWKEKNFLDSRMVPILLNFTIAPNFLNDKNGSNPLNNKCTKISSTTTKWTKFSLNNTCTKISSTTAKWTECSQQQIAPKFHQQQQNGLNFLSTTHASKFPQQQQNGPNALNNKLHQNFLNNNIKMDKILSTTNAPKIPQQQQNGPISLNNKCTQFFQQQKAYSALLSHSLLQLTGLPTATEKIEYMPTKYISN